MAALFCVTFCVANPFSAFGVFLPILAETFGWSRGAISLAMSFNLVLGSFLGLFIGMIADRRGPRALLAITVALEGGGFALAATTQSLWHLHLFVGVIAGVGMSGFYVLATATVARWFTSDFRGLAMGLVLTGFNLGFMTGPPFAAYLIEHIGWRLALVVLGGVFGLVGTLASLVVTFPSGSLAPHAGPRWAGVASVVRDWRLWALSASWLLGGGVMLMLTVHIVPFARDRGIGLEAAAFALAAYGLGAVIGRVAGGLAADRMGTMPIMWTGYGLQVMSLIPLLLPVSQATLLFALVMFGIGFAAADTTFAKVIPELFGLRAIGAVFGILTLTWRWGAALGPATAGYVYDATGSYMIPFAIAPVATAVSFALFLLVARGPRQA